MCIALSLSLSSLPRIPIPLYSLTSSLHHTHTPHVSPYTPPRPSAQAVYLESEPFSLQNNLLTPTQKLKRMEARERYAAIIDELYAKLEQKRALEGAKAQAQAAAARL